MREVYSNVTLGEIGETLTVKDGIREYDRAGLKLLYPVREIFFEIAGKDVSLPISWAKELAAQILQVEELPQATETKQ